MRVSASEKPLELGKNACAILESLQKAKEGFKGRKPRKTRCAILYILVKAEDYIPKDAESAKTFLKVPGNVAVLTMRLL